MTNDTIHTEYESVDELIVWLRRQRSVAPTDSLRTLLKNHVVREDHMIDLACVDLIHRRRLGQSVRTEDYLAEFESLKDDRRCLDLIDAEICVAKELSAPMCADDYVSRFPDLAEPIRELFALDPSSARQSVADSLLVDPVSIDGDSSLEFSISAPSCDDAPIAADVQLPVDIPSDFQHPQCVARRPGQWLLRGRDMVHSQSLAMKVIELPTLLRGAQANLVLDACERAAKVKHPAWVIAHTAAVQRRHLSVVRPWLFARSWNEYQSDTDQTTQIHALATVAFALASAHAVRATHGGLHFENLLIGQDGRVQIVDGAFGSFGVLQDLALDRLADDAFPQRREVDIRDFLKLIATSEVHWDLGGSESVVASFGRLAADEPSDALARIGDTLVAIADGRVGQGTPGGKFMSRSLLDKLSRFWTKQ